MGLKLLGYTITKNQKPKTIKQQVKSATRLKKNVASTLKWMDIHSIDEDRIVLMKNKKKKIVKGIKVHPFNIFIAAEHEQYMRIARLRNVYNKVDFKLYHSFVFNPVNLDSELTYLARRLEVEQVESIRGLLRDDIEKMILFIKSWQELEFFITVQGNDMKDVNKKMDQLSWEFQRAGFQISELNRIDYENYSAYIFENQLINDYLFGHGAFQVLNEFYESETIDDRMADYSDERKSNADFKVSQEMPGARESEGDGYDKHIST